MQGNKIDGMKKALHMGAEPMGKQPKACKLQSDRQSKQRCAARKWLISVENDVRRALHISSFLTPAQMPRCKMLRLFCAVVYG
jgi:hypothetical protein